LESFAVLPLVRVSGSFEALKLEEVSEKLPLQKLYQLSFFGLFALRSSQALQECLRTDLLKLD
jgi:hypothetical protein